MSRLAYKKVFGVLATIAVSFYMEAWFKLGSSLWLGVAALCILIGWWPEVARTFRKRQLVILNISQFGGGTNIQEKIRKYRQQMRDVIQEDSDVRLLRRIQRLYPTLEEQGVRMPPTRALFGTDGWRPYHRELVKELEFEVAKLEDDQVPLDVEKWNEYIARRENARDVSVKEEKAVGLLNEVELQILRLIYDQLKDRKVVTISMIYTHKPFLNISPGVPYKAVVHLTREGYIDASEDESANPFAPASARPWTIHRVTEKGRRALRDGKSEQVVDDE